MNARKRTALRLVAGGNLNEEQGPDGFESEPDVPPLACADCASSPATRLAFTAAPLCAGCSDGRDQLSSVLVAIVFGATAEDLARYVRSGRFPAEVVRLLTDPLHAEEFRAYVDVLLGEWERGRTARAA